MNLQAFEEFDVENENVNELDSDEMEVEYDLVFKMTDGHTVRITEHDCRGMAGEPMTYLVYTREDEVRLDMRYVLAHISEGYRNELLAYSTAISNMNNASAIAWVI